MFESPIKPRNFRKIGTYSVIGLLLIGLITYLILSPWLMLRSWREALAAKDPQPVIDHIDFPKLRENLKAEANAKMAFDMMNTQNSPSANPFESLGRMMAPPIINSMIDSMITPQGIERIIKSDFTSAQIPGGYRVQIFDEKYFDHNTGYDSLNVFMVIATNKTDKTQKIEMIFERRGIFDWQLVNVKAR